MSLKTSIIVNMTGNLERQAKRNARAITSMSRSSNRSLKILQRTAARAGHTLDRMGNRYTAGGTVAALTLAGRQVVGLQRRFTRLGIQANKATGEMESLKQQIFDIAQAPDIKVDPSEITSAIEAIVEKTGDLDFARDNIKNIGAVIQATGAAGASVGEILAEFQKMDIKDPSQVLRAIDILNVQGKEGAFTLANLAALGPRVVTAYTSMGRTGVPALREMGAALQLIRMGTGNSEQAATSFEAVMRTLGDRAKVVKLQASGIQVFDLDQLKQGKEVLRPINELMLEIIQKTGGKKTQLSQIFDAEAMRAFNAASSEFQRTGNLETLKKFMNVQADGTTTLNDSARAAHDAAGGIELMSTAWEKFTNDKLLQPVKDLNAALSSLESGTLQKILGTILSIGGALAAAVIGRKLYKLGTAGAAILTGAADEIAPKPRTTLGGALGQRRKGKLGLGSKVARFGGKALGGLNAAGAVLSAGAVGYEVGSAVNNAIGSDFTYNLINSGKDKRERETFEKKLRALQDANAKLRKPSVASGAAGAPGADGASGQVDINLRIDHAGRGSVQRVTRRGNVRDVNIDSGPLPVGAN